MSIFKRFFEFNNRDGKGVPKRKISDRERYSIKGFFMAYKEKFWNLMVMNLIFVLFMFPIFFYIVTLTGVFDVPTAIQTNVLYAPLYGASLCSPNAATAALMGIFGTKVEYYVPTDMSYLFRTLTLLAFLTFGFANTGLTYVMRGYTRGEYTTQWGDFLRGIKKNFFPALILGAVDLAICALLVYEIVYYYQYSINFTLSVMFAVALLVSAVYCMMRFYMYLLLITFSLKPLKLIKNAFILALVGIKRNLAALAGIMIILAFNILIFYILPGVGLIMPFIFDIGSIWFIASFAAYPNIKKHIIDPYYDQHPEEREDDDDFIEPIFIDRT